MSTVVGGGQVSSEVGGGQVSTEVGGLLKCF